MGDDTTEADVAACWDANTEPWAADVAAGHDRYHELFTWPAFARFVGDVAGLDAVDLGCGEGENTRRLARLGARMTGVDLSGGMIAQARAAEEAEPLGIDYRVVPARDTGLPGSAFDRVVSTMALMDAPEIEGAMREVHRLLRPGGLLAFSVLHPCFITPGTQWKVEEDEAGRTVGLVVSRYFDRTPFTERWRFGARPAAEGETPETFAVPRFPRTLSDWVNAVTDAGLGLRRVEEPVPDEAACRAQPNLARWRDHGAFLLMVRAERPR